MFQKYEWQLSFCKPMMPNNTTKLHLLVCNLLQLSDLGLSVCNHQILVFLCILFDSILLLLYMKVNKPYQHQKPYSKNCKIKHYRSKPHITMIIHVYWRRKNTNSKQKERYIHDMNELKSKKHCSELSFSFFFLCSFSSNIQFYYLHFIWDAN